MKFKNIDVYQLDNILKSKKLVCFGAGKMLHNFMNVYGRFHFEKKTAFLLDNDEKKTGTQVYLGEEKIAIHSLKYFCANCQAEDFMLLISCGDYVTVYEQLQQIEELNHVECCLVPFIRDLTNQSDEKSRFYPGSFRRNKEMTIPKVIHYCWFGYHEIPEKNRKWMNSWKKYCPDYEVTEWNEKNYNVSKNAYMHEAYKAGKWAFVSDFARMDIIYNYGGIYLDTDVEVVRNLDELLYQDAFMGIDGSLDISLGLGFGAKKNLDIIKELRDEYNNRSFYNENGDMNLTAIPTLQIPFFRKKGYIANGEYQKLEEVTIYPEKVLSGKSCFTGKVNITEKTFLVHHYNASWVSKERTMAVNRQKELYRKLCGRV